MSMTEQIRDPVSRVRQSFAMRGESLVVDNWLEAAAAGQQGLFDRRGRPRGLRGARWAAGFLKRYRDETVFVSPPRIVQDLLIALLARDV